MSKARRAHGVTGYGVANPPRLLIGCSPVSRKSVTGGSEHNWSNSQGSLLPSVARVMAQTVVKQNAWTWCGRWVGTQMFESGRHKRGLRSVSARRFPRTRLSVTAQSRKWQHPRTWSMLQRTSISKSSSARISPEYRLSISGPHGPSHASR